MKKILILIALFLLPLRVFAYDKDIVVKYKKKINGTIYTTTVKNEEAKVIVDNRLITINTEDSLNGKEIVIIKVEGDAYNWISNLNGENSYYYVAISNGEELISSSQIKSIAIEESFINLYNTNGNLVDSKNDKIEYQNGEFYFNFGAKKEEPKSGASLTINGEGTVIINEKIYDKSTDIELDNHSKIMIMCEPNNVVKNVYLNDVSIYGNFHDNTLEYDLKDGDKLVVEFEKKESSSTPVEETIDISGYLNKNNVSLQNVKIVLSGDKKYVAYTDNSGYYEFTNIPYGEYEMMIVSDNNENISYKKFKLAKTGTDTSNTLIIGDEDVELNIDVGDNYEATFNVLHKETEIVEETNNYLAITIITIIIFILLTLLIILLRRRSKEKNA